jgi:hypothetical protein
VGNNKTAEEAGRQRTPTCDPIALELRGLMARGALVLPRRRLPFRSSMNSWMALMISSLPVLLNRRTTMVPR